MKEDAEQIMATLRERCRVQAGREPTPSAGIIDTDVYKLSRAKIAPHFLPFNQA